MNPGSIKGAESVDYLNDHRFLEKDSAPMDYECFPNEFFVILHTAPFDQMYLCYRSHYTTLHSHNIFLLPIILLSIYRIDKRVKLDLCMLIGSTFDFMQEISAAFATLRCAYKSALSTFTLVTIRETLHGLSWDFTKLRPHIPLLFKIGQNAAGTSHEDLQKFLRTRK